MKEEGLDPTDYSFVVKRRGSPPKPWRWEIYCAGSMAPVERSAILYETMNKFLVVICSVILAFGLAGCIGKGKAPVGKGKAPVVQTRG